MVILNLIRRAIMNKTRYMSEEEKERAINLYHKGFNTVQIGEILGRSNTTIGSLFKKNNLKPRHSRKLSDEDETSVVIEYLDGATTIFLGEKYNVDANTIANIIRRSGQKLRPNGHKIIIENPRFFENIDSEEKAYFLGFIIADGSIIVDKKGRRTFAFSLKGEDFYILKKLEQLLGLPEGRARMSKRNEGELRTSSPELISDLAKYGVVPNKTATTYIPELSEEFMPHLLRGIFDGDGTVYVTGKYLRFSIYGTNILCNQFLNYLKLHADVTTTGKVFDKETVSFINFPGRDDVYAFYRFIYSDATIYLKRKKEKFDSNLFRLQYANIERAMIHSLCNA